MANSTKRARVDLKLMIRLLVIGYRCPVWVKRRRKRHLKYRSAYRHKADMKFGKSDFVLSMSAIHPASDVNQQVVFLPRLAEGVEELG